MRTKNIFKTLAFAMLMPTMLLTTSCSSDDDFANTNTETTNTETIVKKGYELPVTVNVTRQGDEGTTRATYNESTKKLSFSSGDKLFVSGEEATAGKFAGELTWQSGGTFSGTIYMQNLYEGTADALLTAARTDPNYISATLLPNGYKSTDFLYIATNATEEKYDDQVSCDYDKAFALTKAAAVEQLSYENIGWYDGSFALSPSIPILNFTITGLPASTEVAVVFSYYATTVNKNVTTNSSGTATFAIGVYCDDLADCSLAVGGKFVNLGGHNLYAGHIYNISRKALTYPIALSAVTSDYVGSVITTDGNVYLKKSAAEAASKTPVAMIAYVNGPGDGLAIALEDVSSNELTWDGTGTNNNSKSAEDWCNDWNTSKAVTDGVWRMPSVYEWQTIFIGCGSTSTYVNPLTADDLAFNCDGFKSKLSAAGGTPMQSSEYWSSTQDTDYPGNFWSYYFNENKFDAIFYDSKNYVRALFAF